MFVPIFTLGRIGYNLIKGQNASDKLVNEKLSQDASKIDISNVSERITKSFSLVHLSILTKEEYQKQKLQILNEIETHGINQSPMDALCVLMPLVESGAISVDEMRHVKNMLEDRA